ncbi:potassium-transporting ATPase subunit KdpC [Oryzihumus leptocrescens]|uniref:Potassium-transporting ATPase KdpC subunit n=1 Tax=Oryzihumus leptocrescens TaxID=297536 RepID=A0A542ZHG2_9MICO|nr:potassium-transporting ATPase subunit KdpC [Oryzihumus leptocrescens]TQL59765.1 K+-transporting ATPase ATPase C chain [Oryzihumus leptocrescens]
MTFMRQLGASARMMLLLTLLLGAIYPAAIWGVGQVVRPSAANGSLVEHGGHVVGSSLIGQTFTAPQWFQGRPSAVDYSGDASAASNLPADDPRQVKAVAERKAALLKANPQATGAIPADALTASGSGLDPHISVAYALWQVPRVAAARHLSADQVRTLVDEHTQGRSLGFLGQPRVNVLELNVALASLGSR